MKKILVVDDEATLCEALRFNLEAEGYAVDVAYSAEEALRLDLASYDLVLLDVMMGAKSGFDMAREMKADEATAAVPVIFCTAKSQEDDMIAGLNLGADDYISKPYTIRAVLARVRAVLRRTETKTETKPKNADPITLDQDSKRCFIDGQEVYLPKKQFEMLSLFLAHTGRIFSREEILAKVWGTDVIVTDRTIDVGITRLRQALGKYAERIVTRQGYGYGMSE